METRLTLRPGQSGTKKLLQRYGERLVRVRYLYDRQAGRRLKTVELIVEAVPGDRARAILAGAMTRSLPFASAFRKRTCASARSASAQSGVQSKSYGKSLDAMPSVSALPSACANRTFSKTIHRARYMPAYVAIH
jgi:hypothetical protein